MKSRALLVLAIIFSGSFLGRLAVFASDIVNAAADTAPAETVSTQVEQTCVDGDLAAAIKERAVALDTNEAALAERKATLQVYESQIERRLSELEGANEKLRATLIEHQESRNADIAKLAAIYEGMKPQQAGDIINEMDPKFAAGLLAAMNSEQAALVVATLDAKKAYLISVILANQSQDQ